MKNEQVIMLPDPDLKKPLVQIEFLFDRCFSNDRELQRKKAKHGKWFEKFLILDGEKMGYKYPQPFWIKNHFVIDILPLYKNFLDGAVIQKELAQTTASHKLFFASRAIQFAYNSGWTQNHPFIEARYSHLYINNKPIDSYSNEEIDQIIKSIMKDSVLAKKVIDDKYVKLDLGIDPRIKFKVGKGNRSTYGWFNLNNCVWYIENVLKLNTSHRFSRNEDFKKLRASMLRHGGIVSYLKKIGLPDMIDDHYVGPFVLKLAFLTGMNPSSLYNLKVDCLNENDPLTNSPSIKYMKKRSNGACTQFISIDDEEPQVRDLKQKQFHQIKQVISDVLGLTSSIRGIANEDFKQNLFIYQLRATKNFGSVTRFNDKCFSAFCKGFVQRHQLKNDQGTSLQLHLRRFRPTRISKMCEEGYNVFEIQAGASHKFILTTLKYLRKKNLEPTLEKETTSVLSKILENIEWAKMNTPIEISGHERLGKKPSMYKGILCNCKNVFDPPASVKKSRTYVEGQACSNFNMCLTCSNVIITKFHLPVLFNYRNEILISDGFKSDTLPLQHIYKKTMSVLNSILNEDQSSFSKSDLLEAQAKAETLKPQFHDFLFFNPTQI